MNIQLLEEHMKAQGVGNEEIAKALDMNASTWFRKKKDLGEKLTIGEMDTLCRFLHLTAQEATEIFLPNFSHF